MLSGYTTPSFEAPFLTIAVCGVLLSPIVGARWNYHDASITSSSVSSSAPYYLLFGLEQLFSIALVCSVITYLRIGMAEGWSPTRLEHARRLIYRFSFTCAVSFVFIVTRNPSSFEDIPTLQLTTTVLAFLSFPTTDTTARAIIFKVANAATSFPSLATTTVSAFIATTHNILTTTLRVFVSASSSSATIDNEGLEDADEENLDVMGVREPDSLMSACPGGNGTFEDC